MSTPVNNTGAFRRRQPTKSSSSPRPNQYPSKARYFFWCHVGFHGYLDIRATRARTNIWAIGCYDRGGSCYRLSGGDCK